jgi:hypothetical protein
MKIERLVGETLKTLDLREVKIEGKTIPLRLTETEQDLYLDFTGGENGTTSYSIAISLNGIKFKRHVYDFSNEDRECDETLQYALKDSPGIRKGEFAWRERTLMR